MNNNEPVADIHVWRVNPSLKFMEYSYLGTRFVLIRTWISDRTHWFVWDVITHPYPNFNFDEVKAWASYQLRKIAGYACAGNAGNVFPATAG